MVKAVLKSRPAKKEEVVAMSKKSKSLEKKTSSKKKMAIQSPEAKKVSLVLMKAKSKLAKNKDGEKNKALTLSPDVEIKFKSKVTKKPKSKVQPSKANRFDEMKKIHEVLKEKKLMKAKRDEEDEDSDESADEDDAACKSYADEFNFEDDDLMEEITEEAVNAKPGKKNNAKSDKNKTKLDKTNAKAAKKDAKLEKKKAKADKNDAKLDKNDAELDKNEAKSDESKDDEAKLKKKEQVDPNDPAEQARTVLITNVSLKTTRKQLAHLLRTYGKVVSVRLRNLPVLGKIKGSDVVKLQVKKKQFKKEAKSCSAYVKFEQPEQATAALAANLTVVDNHHLFVVPVVSKSAEEKRRAVAAGKQVVVGNLPFSMEAEPLYQEFISCGDIVCITLPRNKHGSCIGVAFVEFKNKDSVGSALKKNGIEMQGRPIRISKAVRKVKKSGSAGIKIQNDNKKNINNKTDKKKNINNKTDNKKTSNNKTDNKIINNKTDNKKTSNQNKENNNKNISQTEVKKINNNTKKSPTPKKQGTKKRPNKDDLKKRTIARKLAAKK